MVARFDRREKQGKRHVGCADCVRFVVHIPCPDLIAIRQVVVAGDDVAVEVVKRRPGHIQNPDRHLLSTNRDSARKRGRFLYVGSEVIQIRTADVRKTGQDPVALMEKYPTRFKLVHLKDRKPGTQGNQNGQAPEETNVVLGQGDVNIAAVMKEAKKIGIQHYFIEDESLIPEQQVPKSLAYLRQLK